MERNFYLSTHDFLTSPEPRRCEVIGDSFVIETQQPLVGVNVSPPFKDQEINTSWLLLGIADPNLESLVTTEGRPFYVDIYVTEIGQLAQGISSQDLVKMGTGVLHSTYESALSDSPMDD